LLPEFIFKKKNIVDLKFLKEMNSWSLSEERKNVDFFFEKNFRKENSEIFTDFFFSFPEAKR